MSEKEASAASAPHSFAILYHAGGGWTVTHMMDPKAGIGTGADAMGNYLSNGQAGNLFYAALETLPNAANQQDQGLSQKTFFDRHFQDLLVINGIDMATNAHDVGTRAIWAGDMAEGKPTVAALIAAGLAPGAPMGYVSAGGYDTTAGVAPATRLGNIDAVKRLAFPYRSEPNDAESNYLTEATQARIQAARQTRFDVKSKQQRLPRINTALNRLHLSRLGQNELKLLMDYLPPGDELEGGMVGSVQLAAAAFRAGLCAVVSIGSGGWDNHDQVDQNMLGNTADLYPQISRITEVLAAQGIADRSAIFMGSDFGRTPGYNGGQGKDHWAVSSMMVMGYVNGQKIAGNRVVGQTTEGHDPVPLDPNTMQPGGNKRITVGHVQNAIRKLYGIQDSDAARLFPSNAPISEFQDLMILE
ncbi:MAG: DUF1501 domain-containing protein [Polyangiaceae bacterium]|nr:DUF1501 domain-containing protein [Polyangiaceae bacterium]